MLLARSVHRCSSPDLKCGKCCHIKLLLITEVTPAGIHRMQELRGFPVLPLCHQGQPHPGPLTRSNSFQPRLKYVLSGTSTLMAHSKGMAHSVALWWLHSHATQACMPHRRRYQARRCLVHFFDLQNRSSGFQAALWTSYLSILEPGDPLCCRKSCAGR